MAHTADLRERVSDAISGAWLYDGEPDEEFLRYATEGALEAVASWFRDNGYLHADGVLGIGEEASR